MGEIYAAVDVGGGGDAAVKLLRGGASSEPQAVERFLREGRAAARLRSPHVVSVFDVVDDSESGEHWLVMEYVDGMTLADVVRAKGTLSWVSCSSVRPTKLISGML